MPTWGEHLLTCVGVGHKLLTLLPQQRGEQKSKNYGQASFLPWVSEWLHVYSIWRQSLCHLPFSSFLSHTLPTKVDIVKVMVFPVVMWGCESWIIKKMACWKIDAFELWCWRRLLRVPWTARRSNQSILKEINPEYSLEGLILKLKLWYFGHLMRRASSLEKTLMLGQIEGRGEGGDRRWDGRMASPTQWTWVWASSRRWWRTGKPGVVQPRGK